MNCPNCGEEIKEGVSFCPECGKSIRLMPAGKKGPVNLNQLSKNARQAAPVSDSMAEQMETEARNQEEKEALLKQLREFMEWYYNERDECNDLFFHPKDPEQEPVYAFDRLPKEELDKRIKDIKVAIEKGLKGDLETREQAEIAKDLVENQIPWCLEHAQKSREDLEEVKRTSRELTAQLLAEYGIDEEESEIEPDEESVLPDEEYDTKKAEIKTAIDFIEGLLQKDVGLITFKERELIKEANKLGNQNKKEGKALGGFAKRLLRLCKEIDDSLTEYDNKCREKELIREKRRKKTKKTIVVILMIAIIAVASAYGIQTLLQEKRYNQALSLAEENQYDEAILILSELNGYKDSSNILIQLSFERDLWKAENGDADSQVMAAIRYQNGDGVKQDYEKAFYYFNEAAKQGNEVGLYDVGVCYALGIGVEINQAIAVEYYLKAAEKGYAQAMYQLGESYQYGSGVEIDKDIANTWYMKAADLGNSSAMVVVANNFLDTDDKNNQVKGFDLMLQAANLGNLKAMVYVGKEYLAGEIVQRNAVEGFSWFQNAADEGYSEAQYQVGCCYYNGIGVPKDFEKAFIWYKKAVEQGHLKATVMLAQMYRNGEWVIQDIDQARNLLVNSSHTDDPEVQFNIGCTFIKYSDHDKSVYWLNEAAKQGFIPAEIHLAIVQYDYAEYYTSNKSKTDSSGLRTLVSYNESDPVYQAVYNSLFNLASKGLSVEEFRDQSQTTYKGHKVELYHIEYYLADCYLYGEGVPANTKEAEKWFTKSYYHGYEDAKRMLDFMHR